ncbi:hypothetical protein WA158_004051 [Blastocystis sp. Blastoise]
MSSNNKCCSAWHWIKPIIAGQIVSWLITGTSIFSEKISGYGINLAMFQNVWMYFLLMFFYFIKVCQSGWKLKSAWWKYTIIALLDVEANFVVVKAYQYASILSIMLMDSITIPVCMLFAFILFKAKFRWNHFVGVILCIVGLAIFITIDIQKATDSSTPVVNATEYILTSLYQNATEAPTIAPQDDSTLHIIGDCLAMLGAVLYAISNLFQEYLVKSYDMFEFLSMMGVNGTIIGCIHFLCTELPEIMSTQWTVDIILCFVAYAILLMFMYLCTAYFMSIADATSFNLNLLTSDVYAAFLSYFIFGIIPGYVYYISLVLTIVGLILYYIQGYKSVFKPNGEEEPKKIEKSVKSTPV